MTFKKRTNLLANRKFSLLLIIDYNFFFFFIGELELYNHHQILSENGKTITEHNLKLNDVRSQVNTEIKKNDL